MFFCKKIWVVFSCWFLMMGYTVAQNLVPNPSFESYTACPTTISQIYYATPWTGPTANSTDYFNTCSTATTNITIPRDRLYPRTGDAMVGFGSYNGTGMNAREYLQAPLKNTMIAGKCYYVEFYISLIIYYRYAINNIGAYFNNQAFTTSASFSNLLNYNPSILKFGNPIINDTLSWAKINGIYIASGTESYITIGNFKDDVHTDTLTYNTGYTSPPRASYYFIDDVSVIPTDSISMSPQAGNDTTIVLGDSTFIGQQLYGLHCNWYSNSVLLDTNISGIWVKPNVTTTYVVQQNLCGNIGYDTVVVNVSPLGINEFKNEWLKIYPNPAKEMLNVECVSKNAEIKITDVFGDIVKQQKIASDKTSINISDLKEGVYFVQVQTNKNIYTQKIIIQ